MATTITSNDGYTSSVSPDPVPEFKPSSFAENDSFEMDLLRPSIEAEKKYQEEGLKIRRENYETIKKHTLDFDNFEPEQTNEVRNRVLVSGYLDSQFSEGDRPSSDHDILRDSVAKHKFNGEGVGSDEAFVAAIRKDFEGENKKKEFYDDLDRKAVLSAFMGGGAPKKEFQQSAAGNPLAKSERLEINERWQQHQDAIEEEYGASMLFDIRTTFKEMQEGGDWLMFASNRTKDYTNEERTQFMGALRELTTAYPDQFAADSFVGNLLTGGGRGVGAAAESGSQAALEFFRNAGAGVHNVFVAPFAEVLGTEESREWSEGKREESEERLKRARDIADFRSELESLYQQEYSPIQPLAPKDTALRAIEEGVYAAPGAVATSAMAAVPVVGMPMVFGTIREMERQKYRGEIMANGGTREQASELSGNMATVSAVPQMLAEKFQSFGLTGRVPGLDKVFGKVDDLITNRLARGTTKFAMGGLAETGVELGQEIISDGVQDLTAAFHEIVPDVEWHNGVDGHFDGYFHKFLSTAVAVSPLAVTVATGGLSQEKRAAAFKKASPLERKAFGFTAEANQAMEEAETPRQQVKALQQGMETRDAFSDEAQEAVEELEEMERQKARTQEEADRIGVSPSVRVSPDQQGFQVFDRLTGDTISEVETAQEATDEVFNQLQLKEQENRQYFQELLASFEAAALDVEQSGEAVEVGTGTFTDADAEAAMPGSDRRLQTERELLEQRDGGTGEVAREVMSEGQSGSIAGAYIPAGQMGRKEAVTQLHNGSSVLTLIHERGHAKRRKLMESGAWKREDQISSLRNLDKLIAQTEEKFLPENFDELNEYDQEVAIDEAIAELSEVLALNSRKGKNSKMGSLVTRNLSAMVRARVPGAAQLKSFLGSMRDFFGLQLRRATILRKAVRDGNLDQAQVDQLTDMLVGTNSQEVFEQERDAVPVEMIDGQVVDTSSPSFSITPADTSYRIQHQPSSDDATLNDLTEMFGEDIYGPNAAQYYGAGMTGESEVLDIFKKVRGNPEARVTIYRVVPAFADQINAGDWVTISKEAANEMNNAEFLGVDSSGNPQESKIISKVVTAKEVTWPGDSMQEQGYFPSSPSFSITPAQDAEYMAAVESGDVETQQRMVDEAAKAAGYAGPWFHGAPEGVKITEFRRGDLGVHFGTREQAGFKNKNVIKAYLDKGRNVRVDSDFGFWMGGETIDTLERAGFDRMELQAIWDKKNRTSTNAKESANILAEGLIELGIDSITYPNAFEGKGDSVVVLNPNQAKSADPVTRDADGNVIPLSQRFDQSRDEISFSPGDARMLSDLSENVMRRVRAPEARAVVFEQLVDRIDALKRDVSKMIFGGTVEQEALPDARSMKSLKKESAMRQALRYEELENEVLSKEGQALAQGDAMTLKDMPLHGYIAKPGKGLAGGAIESRSSFTKRTGNKPGAEYEGSEGMVSGLIFGGMRSPDQMARELYDEGIIAEDSTGLMWEMLASERASVKDQQEDFKKALKRIAEAKKQAKTEANEWLEEQVAQQKKYYNPVARIRRSLVMYDAILKTLPPELRGKMGGFVQIAKLNSDKKRLEFLQEKVEQLDKEVDKWISGKHRKQIENIFKANRPKKKSSGQSKVDSDATYADQVMEIEKISKMTREQVDAEIEDIDQSLEKEEDEFEIMELTDRRDKLSVFGNIDGMKANALGDFYQNLNTIHRQGKLLKAMSDEQFNQFLRETIDIVNNDVTGGQGEMTQSEAKLKDESRKARVIPTRFIGAEDVKIDGLSDFHRKNISFEWLMNTISRANKSVGTLASETHKRLSTMVHIATHQEKRDNLSTQEQFREVLAGIFGVVAPGQTSINMDLTNKIHEMEKVEQTNISKMEYGRKGRSSTKRIPASKVQALLNGEATIEGLGISKSDWAAIQARYAEIKESGKSIKPNTRVEYESQTEGEAKMMALSQSQAINLTMLWRQKGLKDSMEHEGYSDQTMKDMEEFLTPESKEIREWLAIQYEDNYHKINKVFRAQNGFSLPKTDFYSPAIRMAQKEAKDMSIDSEGRQAMSVDPNFTITRTTNRAPMDQTAGALSIWMAHSTQTNHYVAWADTVKVLRSVFSDQSVRNNIRGYVGRSALETIDERLEWFADGGNRHAKHIAALDKLRAAHTYGSLGFKWSIAMKQLTSLPAYAFDMSFKDFGKYFGLFVKDFKKNIGEMIDTPYVQNRFKSGYERDVIDGLRREGGSRFMKALQVGMLSGKAGDIVPVIIGGWMARQRSYDNAKKAGLSDADARKKSDIDFEMITDRAQQAGDMKDLSSFQGGGSMFKLFTMYKTSPRQYYANVSESFLDVLAGKEGSKKDFARRFFIAQVMLPLTFQFVSDITKAPFRDDDEETISGENYLRAMLLGPLNGIFIAGDALDMLISGIADTTIWAKKVTILDGVQEVAQGFGKLNARGLISSFMSGEDWDGDITGAADKIARGMGRITPGAMTFYDIIRDEIKRLEGVTEVFD